MGKTKYLSAFERGIAVGARFECAKNYNAAGSHTTVSREYQ
jgi:hypothetical protein